MKIGVDAFGLEHGKSGLGSYLLSLLKSLPDTKDSNIELFGPEADRYTYISNRAFNYNGISIKDSAAAERRWHIKKADRFCRKNGYSGEQVKGYVEGIVAGAASRKREFGNKTESVRKAVVNDMGFLLNSIENALKLARKAGFEVENSNSEKKDCYDIHIRVKKHKKDPK